MHFDPITHIFRGQDGAIWDDTLIRLDHDGSARVYDLRQLSPGCETEPVATFMLDRWETLRPHSNAVAFGPYRFAPEDEFPLLYTNIYNNYASAPDRLEGTLCAYRLTRTKEGFTSQLVQVLRIGFVQDVAWRSGDDVRPYGNFAVDRQTNTLYAFVMRDRDQVTRYFAFDLPLPGEGETLPDLSVPCVTLSLHSVRAAFDCPYHRFIQGACIHGRKLYSLEGFTNNEENPPAIRVIDLAAQKQAEYICLPDLGLTVEPELIDFHGESCLYADVHGQLYQVSF